MSTKRDILMWNEKCLSVSDRQIMTFSGWSASSSFETEDKENGKKMKKTKAKGANKGTVTFSVHLNQALGTDVKTEYKWWREQTNSGKYSFLYLGMDQFGDYKWMLSKVDQQNLITYKDGTWKSCDMTLSFEEYYVKVKKTKLQKKAEKLAKKLAKQLKKAQTAKSEKARKKAALKAAALTKQLEETQVKIAIQAAETYKAQKTMEEHAAQHITQYYDRILNGENEKDINKEISNAESKKFDKEVNDLFKQLTAKNSTMKFFDVQEMYQDELKVVIASKKYYITTDGSVIKIPS